MTEAMSPLGVIVIQPSAAAADCKSNKQSKSAMMMMGAAECPGEVGQGSALAGGLAGSKTPRLACKSEVQTRNGASAEV